MKLFCLLQVKCLLSPLLKHACTNLSGNVPALRSICLLLRAFRLVVHSIDISLRVLLFCIKICYQETLSILFSQQPMLDVPIYGRIATIELFRPHVSYLAVPTPVILILCREVFRLIFYFFLLLRMRLKIFFSLLRRGTNSVFCNGTQKNQSSSPGLGHLLSWLLTL